MFKPVLLLLLPVAISFALWYSVATPWFCSGLCCLSEKFCPQVKALGEIAGPEYQSLRDAFEHSLTVGWDLGASLYVAVNGSTVVDLAGGFQDGSRQKPYAKDTASCIFSSGKVLENIAVAIAVERGLLKLDDPIAKHWPEFGVALNGQSTPKALVTIGDLLSHRSGSSTNFEVTPEVETLVHVEKRDTFLASQKFPYPRGTVGYRGFGSALYTDAIFRRVDPRHRSLADFVKEEVMDLVHGGRLTCPPVTLKEPGLSPVHQASPLTLLLGALPQAFLSWPSLFRGFLGADHRFVMAESEAAFMKKIVTKTGVFAEPTIPDMDQGAASYNNVSSFLAYPMLSSNCFSTALAIGSAADNFFNGKIVSEAVKKEFTSPLAQAYDHWLMCNITYTKGGFGVGGNMIIPYSPAWNCIGWGGLGGSVLQHCHIGDSSLVTFAYVPNGLSPRVTNERGTMLLEETLELVKRLG